MNYPSLIFLGVFLLSTPAGAAKWDLADNRVGGALINLEKTRDDKFEGAKLVAEGQYVLKRKPGQVSEERACCTMPSRPENFYGLLDALFQVGLEGTGLEDMPLVELLNNLDKVPEDRRAKVFNCGAQHFNHSFYWQSVSPGGGGQPKGALADAINKAEAHDPAILKLRVWRPEKEKSDKKIPALKDVNLKSIGKFLKPWSKGETMTVTIKLQTLGKYSGLIRPNITLQSVTVNGPLRP